MRVAQCVSAAVVAGALALGQSTASAQETPQALRQEIDQLRRDFDTLKQQYGDRLTALETKLAALLFPGFVPTATVLAALILYCSNIRLGG